MSARGQSGRKASLQSAAEQPGIAGRLDRAVRRVTEKTEGGLSSPPGGQECPPSFFDRYADLEQHERRLPHWQQGAVFYFVTWRLADALPKGKLDEWRDARDAWLRWHPEPWDEATEAEYHRLFSRQIDAWLDAGSGPCLLRDAQLAQIVAWALRHFDGERYVLKAFVVMPNHVHVLFRLVAPHRLEDVLKSWKGFTAREINRRLDRSGQLWQEEYWDRMIRNEEHFMKCREYLLRNPAKAALREGEFVLYDASTEGGLSSPPGGQECPPSV
jgi:REP element-mobilizing transposase RayT